MQRFNRLIGSSVLWSFIGIGLANAAELGTGIPYQGRLENDGTPFNGTIDLIFELWDSESGGLQIGGPVQVFAVPVSDGAFAVEINSADEFGAEAFVGEARWLHLQVRDASVGGAYDPLTPRQKVAAAPFALFAASTSVVGGETFWEANAAGIHYLDGNVGIGTMTPASPLDVAGQIRSTGVTGGEVAAYNPNNQGASVHLSWLNDVARLRVGGSGAGALGGLDIQRQGDASMMRILNNGNVGIGNTAPATRLHLTGGSDASVTGGGYMTAGATTGANLVIDDNEIMARNNGVGAPLSINAEGGNVLLINTGTGNAGIGIASPSAKLHVRGIGTGFGEHVAVFENTSTNNGDGVAIKINQLHTNRENNFVTFLNSANHVRGRIEGFDLESGDWVNPPPIPSLSLDIDLGITPRPIAQWFNFGSLTFNPPSLTFTACSILGFDIICLPFMFDSGSLQYTSPSVTSSPVILGTPSIDFTLPSLAQVQALLCWAFENDLASLVTLDPLALATEGLRRTAAQLCLDEGVIYGSKGADYAEYLEKVYPNEPLRSGYVVGVFGGKISRYTKDAEQVMVISTAPVVVGNMPDDQDRERFAKVAFMGQVPVVARGPVRSGDYLLPSGLHDGSAVAVAPADLTVEDISQVIGRAWSASSEELGFVNILVGVRDEAATHVMRRQQEQLADQAEKIDVLSQQLRAVATRVGVSLDE